MLPIKSFHPKVIISNHFDNIKYQIDINTEVILENLEKLTLNTEKIRNLNDLREKQIDKNNEIESINLNMVTFNEDEYKCVWQHVINDESINYDYKIDLMKEKLIINDCILMKDSDFKSNKSLWIMPYYCNLKNVELLRNFDDDNFVLKQQNVKGRNRYVKHKTLFRHQNPILSKFLQKPRILNQNLVKIICLVNQKENYSDYGIRDFRNVDWKMIKEFSFKKFSKKKEVEYYMELNFIEKGAFEIFQNLEKLDLSRAYFEKIDDGLFDNLDKLKILNFSFNQVSIIGPNTFTRLTKLEELYLENNKIVCLDPDSLSHLKNLRILNLECNQLGSIDNTNAKLFDGLVNLEKLILDSNKFNYIESDLLNNLKSLKILNIDNVRMKCDIFTDGLLLRAFLFLDNLEELHIEQNNIRKVELGSFKNLKNLKKLFLGFNLLECNEPIFNGLDNLQELHINNNDLEKVNLELFKSLPNLKILDLSNNTIFLESPIFHGLKNLEELNLNNNQITKLKIGLFKDLCGVKKLDLGFNQIDLLHAPFEELTNLEYLDLSHNNLKKIEISFLNKFKQLNNLILIGNMIDSSRNLDTWSKYNQDFKWKTNV